MGFRRNIGSTRTCRVRNGYIEIEDSGVTYPTTIPVDTDWQCNMFESPVVSFVIIDGDDIYIGTQYGAVGKYRYDGLLLALYTWEAPHDSPDLVGYYNDRGFIREARAYEDDPRTILIRGSRRTFKLDDGMIPEKIDEEDSETAFILRCAMVKETGLHVELKGGVLVDETKHGHWEIDPSLSTVPTLQL